MTNNYEQILKTNFDSVVKAASVMLKAAEDRSATPEDVVNTLNSVVDTLTSLSASIPVSQSPPTGSTPPGQQAEPANRMAVLEKDTAEESREKVQEQTNAQLALRDKTYKAMQDRIDSLEADKARHDRENLAERVSDIYPVNQRQAKHDEVIKSDKPNDYWETFIEAAEELTEGQIKPAKNINVWLPTKIAKQRAQHVKFI